VIRRSERKERESSPRVRFPAMLRRAAHWKSTLPVMQRVLEAAKTQTRFSKARGACLCDRHTRLRPGEEGGCGWRRYGGGVLRACDAVLVSLRD
jgi:hypothetical protein